MKFPAIRSMQVTPLHIVTTASALMIAILSASSSAYAQYGVDPTPANATPEQLQECEELNIPASECTENAILAKRRLIYAMQNSGQEPIMLSGTSSSGSYAVNISWRPDDIQKNNQFDIVVLDSNRAQLSSASFAFAIFGDGESVKQGEGWTGAAKTYYYSFEKPGSYSLRVSNINGSGEYVEIPIQVTPEFPLGAAIVLVGLISFIVLISKGVLGIHGIRG